MVADGQLSMLSPTFPLRCCHCRGTSTMAFTNLGCTGSQEYMACTITVAFLDEHAQRALIECIDNNSWRTDLERRVQHYGWRYDYRTKSVTRLI